MWRFFQRLASRIRCSALIGWTLMLKYNFHSFRCFIPNWPYWECAHFSWLKWGPTNPIWESARFCLLSFLSDPIPIIALSCKSLRHFLVQIGFVIVVTWISLSFGEIDTWIPLVFTCSYQSCNNFYTLPNKTKLEFGPKFQNLSKLLIWTKEVVWVKVLNAIEPLCLVWLVSRNLISEKLRQTERPL